MAEALAKVVPIAERDKLTETIEKVCDRHGKYEAKVATLLGTKIETRCPACESEREAEWQRREREQEQRKLRSRIEEAKKACAIPARFAMATFDGYEARTNEQAKALATAKAFAEKFTDLSASGANLIFSGNPGTGKTHLAAAIANRLLDQGRRVFYRRVYELLREIKDSWAQDSEASESEVVRKYSKVELLILDEVGVQFGKDSDKILMFELLDNRYANRKPSVIVSNLDEEGMTQFLGERVIDRLCDSSSAMVAFNWDSYRRR
jgi:DNA replication protein DnaC